MGTQQLLMVVIGVILVGIMIAVGLFMFRDQSAATNRDEISNDLVYLSSQAQKYYRRPTILGGGNNSFATLTIDKLTSRPSNANGSYSVVDPMQNQVTIVGVGLETGNDGANPVQITVTVWADSLFMVTDN